MRGWRGPAAPRVRKRARQRRPPWRAGAHGAASASRAGPGRAEEPGRAPASAGPRPGSGEGGRESRARGARGCAVTQASPGQGGTRPTPDGPPLFPAPHLPLETPAVNLFLAHPGGKGPFSFIPLWRPTARATRGLDTLPSSCPPHLRLWVLALPQAQARPHPTTWPPFSAPNRQSLGHRRQDVRMSHASCSRREAGSTRPTQSTWGARPAAARALAHPAESPLFHSEAPLLGLF